MRMAILAFGLLAACANLPQELPRDVTSCKLATAKVVALSQTLLALVDLFTPKAQFLQAHLATAQGAADLACQLVLPEATP